MNIDEKFYKGEDRKPHGNTVKDLRLLLEQLPDDLPIMQDYTEVGFMLTVFNIKQDNKHLGIHAIDE